MFRYLKILIVIFAGISWVVVSHAETSESNVWLYYTIDEDDTEDLLLALSLAVTKDGQINLAVGETTNTYTLDLGGTPREVEITTNLFSVEYSMLFESPWLVSLGYEYWGKSEEVELNSLNVNLEYFFQSWITGMNLQYRDIDLYNRDPMAATQRITTNSVRFGIFLEKVWQHVSWSVYGDWYDYEDDLTGINSLAGIRFLGLRNFTHTSILVNWDAGTSLKYDFNNPALALKYGISEAALTGLESETLALVLNADLTEQIMLDFELGRAFSDQNINTLDSDYVMLGLGARF